MFQFQREKEKNGIDLTQSYMYNNNKNIVTTPNANKMFNNTAIVDRLRMVRWSNHCHPTGVVTGFRARIKLKRLNFTVKL